VTDEGEAEGLLYFTNKTANPQNSYTLWKVPTHFHSPPKPSPSRGKVARRSRDG
jgi:hypothetical protein